LDLGGNKHETANARTGRGDLRDVRQTQGIDRCVQREDFDLALIDQGSSGSEGRQVIGYLIRYNLRTPFIVLARRTDAEWYKQALALGAVDYLKKPVATEEMNWIIQRFLSLGNSLTK
jgi:DNA-binding NarL/FixJ family response regulator